MTALLTALVALIAAVGTAWVTASSARRAEAMARLTEAVEHTRRWAGEAPLVDPELRAAADLARQIEAHPLGLAGQETDDLIARIDADLLEDEWGRIRSNQERRAPLTWEQTDAGFEPVELRAWGRSEPIAIIAQEAS